MPAARWCLFCLILAPAGCLAPVEEKPLTDYTCESGNFVVQFPGKPRWRYKRYGLADVHIGEGENPGLEFAVGYGDAIWSPDKKTMMKMFQGMKDAILDETKGTLLYTTDAVASGHVGMDFGIKIPGNKDLQAKFKAFIVGRRMYLLGVYGDRFKVNSPQASQFFSSFRLIQPEAK